MLSVDQLIERNARVRRGENTKGRPIQDWNSISGQRIGEILQAMMDISFEEFVEEYSDTEGNPQLTSLGGGNMELITGNRKQIDGRIQNEEDNRIILIGESKWLKDQKHQNDKGGWILALPSTLIPNYPSVSGMFCLFAGPWVGTSAHDSISVNTFFRSVVISFEQMVNFLNEELEIDYRLNEDNNLVNPREIIERWCDAEDEYLEADENPYVAWANLLLELEIDNESINQLIQTSLRELIEATVDFELEGFSLTVRTQRGEFQYTIDEIEEANSIIEEWANNPQLAYENYVSLSD
jgi:hypothetical protein